MLPPGYSITTASGLKTLWHGGHCVTVQSADVSDTVLEQIAERYSRCHTPVCDPANDVQDLVTITEIARKLGLPRQIVALRLHRACRRHRILPAQRNRPVRYHWQDVLAIPQIAAPARIPLKPPVGRNAMIIKARRAGRTLQEIADAHGLTHERIRQILKRVAERSGAPVGRPCSDCGTILTGRAARRGLCHRCAARRAPKRTCKLCGRRFVIEGRAHTYCPVCQTETRPCAACGRPVTCDRSRDGGRFQNRQWFCNRRCFGRWAGRTHGFAAHPPARVSAPVVKQIFGVALVLPDALVRRFDTERIAVACDGATLTLIGARHLDTGANTRALVYPQPGIVARQIDITAIARAVPWLRPGTTFEIVDLRRHRAVLRPILPTSAPVGADTPVATDESAT